jgi:hypothetical protein
MNDNLDNKLLNLTQNFRVLLDYFGLFILFAFIAGPIVYILWIRNYIIQLLSVVGYLEKSFNRKLSK